MEVLIHKLDAMGAIILKIATYLISITVVSQLLLPCSLLAQTSTHGTVNIFLANTNGLVAVTDSQLSDHRLPRGFGQKLFRVDDQTICTIAGFYSNSGPSFGGEFATKTEISSLMQRYISVAHEFKRGTPLAVKLEALVNALTFSLEMVATANRLSGSSALPDISQVTIAGYEQGKIKILQTTLAPHLVNGAYQYDRETQRAVEVTSKFVFITAGLDIVAQLMLSDPKSEYSQGSVTLEKYFDDKVASSGQTLSIDDLEAVGKELEFQSARRYKGLVGGPLQVAFLTRGIVSKFDQPIATDTSLNPYRIGVVEDAGLSGSDGEAIATKGAIAVFVQNETFSDVNQHLDKLFVTGSTFKDMLFWYSGSPVVLFDSTNTIENCGLVLEDGVTRKNQFVSSLLEHYPQLKVVDAAKVRPIAPVSLVSFER